MGIIQQAKDKVKEKQDAAVKKATQDMTDFICNEVKKEINPKIEEVAEKINRRAISYQVQLEKRIQATLDKQVETFNAHLNEAGENLKDFVKKTIKEEIKKQYDKK